MLYLILLLHVLLAAEASLNNNNTPIKGKKSIKYIGPVVYSNLPPPVVYFPPVPEVPKGPYTASPHPVQFVPFPYNELPVLIYRSKHNPPIHVVNQNKLVSQNVVGESNPHYKDYSQDSKDDLIAEGSETVKTKIATKSPFRSLFEQKPIYIESPPPPKPIYVSPSRNIVRRQKGVYSAGAMHNRLKMQNGDLDTSDSRIKFKTLSGPKFTITKAYVSQKRPLFDFIPRPISAISIKKDYLSEILSSILGGITSTTHNINRFFGIRRPSSKTIPSLREKVKEYRLRKMLGLKSSRFPYLSGYGNQAVDPEFASHLSEQITQTFIDELRNHASHGKVKYTTKPPKYTEGKPLLPSESHMEYPKYTHKVSTPTSKTTIATTTTTTAPIHKKPPIIIFQGIRPPIYVYRKPVSQIYDDTEVIKPPLPQYKPPQALHEQPPPIYKTLPFSPLDIAKANEDDNNKSSLIISSNKDKVWQPVLHGSEESKDDSIIDISNHKMDSSEHYKD
ncbi:uncharacterized protein LOC111621483 [Centruroides sculpturatus]|uniref:uncharacterized protein LOC111621483 n=1 Tax=Centruroides sculpturatus TaxID=218467 RepID=UPI000C6D36E3|nr:uncharacterized protein LOC111621483 [Centruroides sculpturatus]XP_023219407.1 uncharacterized protein LOC111621483 [Centruroides sculpturatus]